jgi:hypothetical protein
MKTTLTTIALLIGMVCSAQSTQIKTISKKKIAYNEYSVKQMISNSDTTTYVYVFYRNAEYQYITEYGSLMFSTKEDAKQFTDALQSCLQQSTNDFYMVEFKGGYVVNSKSWVTIYNDKKQWYMVGKKKLSDVNNFLNESMIYLK